MLASPTHLVGIFLHLHAIIVQMGKAIRKVRFINLLFVSAGFVLIAAACHSEQTAGPSLDSGEGEAPESGGPLVAQNRTIAIQAGHGLGKSGAAFCRSDPSVPNIGNESELNEAIAEKVVAFLGEVYGSQNVQLFVGEDPDLQGLSADAFVALHADQGVEGVTGYKVSRYRGNPTSGLNDSGDESDKLVEALWEEYGPATGLVRDTSAGHFTTKMLNYYALGWIDEQTPGAIIEMGWLCDDLELLLLHQEVVALGIARGVTRFLGDDISLIPIVPVPDVRVESMELDGGRTTPSPTEEEQSSRQRGCPVSEVIQNDLQSVAEWTTCAVLAQDAGAIGDLVGSRGASYAPYAVGAGFPGYNNADELSNSLQVELNASNPMCTGYDILYGGGPDKLSVWFDGIIIEEEHFGDGRPGLVNFLFFKFDDDYELAAIVSVPSDFEPEFTSNFVGCFDNLPIPPAALPSDVGPATEVIRVGSLDDSKMILENGVGCGYLGGGTRAFGLDRLNYICEGDWWLLGEPTMGRVWSIRAAILSDDLARIVQETRFNIRTIWYWEN